MSKTRNSQGSTCPEGWRKAGIKVPVSLTVKQEQYASRSVGIARAVFNLSRAAAKRTTPYHWGGVKLCHRGDA